MKNADRASAHALIPIPTSLVIIINYSRQKFWVRAMNNILFYIGEKSTATSYMWG